MGNGVSSVGCKQNDIAHKFDPKDETQIIDEAQEASETNKNIDFESVQTGRFSRTPKPTVLKTPKPTKAPKPPKPTKLKTSKPTKSPKTKKPTKLKTPKPTKSPRTPKPVKIKTPRPNRRSD